MQPSQPRISEEDIRAAFDSDDWQRAARLSIECYGREVLGFLIARLKNPADGQEAFAMFAEDLWRGLTNFGWQCSMRCWAYTLARNAASRLAASPARRPERNLALAEFASVRAIADTIRRETPLYRRTTLKRCVRALRERLSVEDQTVLMLHVDRGLGFRELAVVMKGEAEPLLDDDALTRDASRLRKRFQRIKSELKRMAREQLLPNVPTATPAGESGARLADRKRDDA